MSNRIKASGVLPRKSLGQNFLTDDATARRIVAAAQIAPTDLVFEIGPGIGALTKHLAAQAQHVIAIELDAMLIPILHRELEEASNVTVVHADALEVDWVKLAQVAERHTDNAFTAIRFVANLPYYITSAAIRRILECGLKTTVIVLTVQLEVAERIAAQPPSMSLLAVSVQFYGKTELLFRIPPSQFYPQPDIDSAVVRITPHTPGYSIDADLFFRWVKAAFSQPRKQLRNTLAAGLRMTKPQIEAILSRSDIDPSRRAETVAMSEWLVLYDTVMSAAQTDPPVGAPNMPS